MEAKRTGLVADPIYREHRPGRGHPECPARYDAALRGIEAAVPAGALLRLEPRAATAEEVLSCHTPEYLRTVEADVASGSGSLSTGDTDICERTLEVAMWAAGGVLVAVDAVLEGKVRNAFCAVRPPGHHATPDGGMGFCVFNNVAIAARYAQRKHGIGRVLIVDWDIHHGNGTQEIFYRDPTVFYFSAHQWPCYPGTGAVRETGSAEGHGFTMNCPFAPGSGGVEVLGAVRTRLVPAMRAFRPELVMISAGFDGREGDPIGNFVLTDADFAELTGAVMEIADEYARGRLVSVLEGGYDLAGLASAVGAHVKRLTAGGS